jgi:hypothetical protein
MVREFVNGLEMSLGNEGGGGVPNQHASKQLQQQNTANLSLSQSESRTQILSYRLSQSPITPLPARETGLGSPRSVTPRPSVVLPSCLPISSCFFPILYHPPEEDFFRFLEGVFKLLIFLVLHTEITGFPLIFRVLCRPHLLYNLDHRASSL